MHYLLCPPSFLTAHSRNLLPSLCSSVPFVNPVSRTLPPSSLLLPNITILQSPCFLSITVPPCHLREQLNHLWPNLSFNDVWTLQGPPVPYKRLLLQVIFFTWCVHSKTNSAGWVSVACMNACVCERETDHLLQLFSGVPPLLRPWPIFGFVHESRMGEFGAGEPCARKNIWHCWDTDTCCWTCESAVWIIRN